MTLDRPRLRPLELVPEGHGEAARMVLRDRQGWTPPVTLPPGAVVLISLMDGRRTLEEIQSDYSQLTNIWQPLDSLADLVRRLDSAFLLDGARFEEYRRPEVQMFLQSRVRAAFGAGTEYPSDPSILRRWLDSAIEPAKVSSAQNLEGASPGGRRLRGVASPASLGAGAVACGAAFHRLSEESDADLFVVLGACRRPMRETFCVLGKDFETPLGTACVDREWIESLAANFATARCASREPLYTDAMAHRTETSIEISVVFLQHVFAGRRPVQIVPVLVGDWHSGGADSASPLPSTGTLRDRQAFVAAMRATECQSSRRANYILAADFTAADFSNERPKGGAGRLNDHSSGDRDATSPNLFDVSPSSSVISRPAARKVDLLAQLTGAVEAEPLGPASARVEAAAFYER